MQFLGAVVEEVGELGEFEKYPSPTYPYTCIHIYNYIYTHIHEECDSDCYILCLRRRIWDQTPVCITNNQVL